MKHYRQWAQSNLNKMQIPSPQQLAKAIANTSLSLDDKKTIVASIRFLSPKKIALLYQRLLELQKEEQRFINEVNRIDLRYKMKLEAEIEKAKQKAEVKLSNISSINL